MSIYFMHGKYNHDSLKNINTQRTEEAIHIIKHNDGKVIEMYVLLGEKNLVIIADFPNTEKVLKASIELHKLTNISFTSSPAITVIEFDELMEGGED